jgi:hypothetical protein
MKISSIRLDSFIRGSTIDSLRLNELVENGVMGHLPLGFCKFIAAADLILGCRGLNAGMEATFEEVCVGVTGFACQVEQAVLSPLTSKNRIKRQPTILYFRRISKKESMTAI